MILSTWSKRAGIDRCHGVCDLTEKWWLQLIPVKHLLNTPMCGLCAILLSKQSDVFLSTYLEVSLIQVLQNKGPTSVPSTSKTIQHFRLFFLCLTFLVVSVQTTGNFEVLMTLTPDSSDNWIVESHFPTADFMLKFLPMEKTNSLHTIVHVGRHEIFATSAVHVLHGYLSMS